MQELPAWATDMDGVTEQEIAQGFALLSIDRLRAECERPVTAATRALTRQALAAVWAALEGMSDLTAQAC